MRLASIPPRPPRRRQAAGGSKKNASPQRSFSGRKPHATLRSAPGPFFSPPGFRFSFGLVALAAGKHPFPSRTRPLRLHAVMILRPGAWESNAPPILFFPDGFRRVTARGSRLFHFPRNLRCGNRSRILCYENTIRVNGEFEKTLEFRKLN